MSTDEQLNALRRAAKVRECQQLRPCNGWRPVVFEAMRLDGVLHIGVCYQPDSVKVGDCFHYDHGAGIDKNSDSIIVYIG